MDDLLKKIKALHEHVAEGLKKLDAPKLEAEITNLQKQMAAPDFWADNLAAQKAAQREAKLRAQLEPWRQLATDLAEAKELAGSGDASLHAELSTQLADLQKRYDTLKHDLMFNGPYDDHDALIRLSAGAGGTDAQDWTQMLERMYLRWAEQHSIKTELIEESQGEEAGLKSATISFSGPYTYGRLKSEHGVHRLVRLSPFNADNLRQTSFALVEVLPQIETPEEVQIDDKDLRVDVYRSSGHGGQSVNTTDSAVRITHMPTGIVVAIQNERSQLQNKETALKILRSKLAHLQLEQHTKTLSELKGPTKSAEWGSQIRNYVLHPYTLVKDARTGHETHDAEGVLGGALDPFIESYLHHQS
jgi:peptide chain release factor 2